MFKANPDITVNPNANDLSKNIEDAALFLPSISSIYAKIVSMETYSQRTELPKGLTNGLKELHFLDPANNLFYYPAALYSAGHADLNPESSWSVEAMVQQRDRNSTVIIGDSGGFQAANGVLKYPWQPKPNQTLEDLKSDQDGFKLKILKWLEATADYSMLLDWPTHSMLRYGVDPVTGECLHPGLKTFADCLNGSLENHKFFAKHRTPGKTKFLNVLQGRNQEENDIWWEAVKDLPFEGWALGGAQVMNNAISLRRLIRMRDTGYLQGREWIHYLGIGKIKTACYLTTIQRSLRKYVDPELTVSFDASSPFVSTAMGKAYYGWFLTHERNGFTLDNMPDAKELKNNPMLLNDWLQDKTANFKPSTIGSRINLGDICVRGYEDLEYKLIPWSKKEQATDHYKNSPEARANDQFKWTRAYKEYITHHPEQGGLFDWGTVDFSDPTKKYQTKWPSSLDGFSYLLIMNHNLELHINSMRAATEAQDLPIEQASQLLTSDLLEFKDLCPDIFTSERPMDLIAKHEKLLQSLGGRDMESTTVKNVEDIFYE